MRIAGSGEEPGTLWNVSQLGQSVASNLRHTKEGNSKTKDDHVHSDDDLLAIAYVSATIHRNRSTSMRHSQEPDSAGNESSVIARCAPAGQDIQCESENVRDTAEDSDGRDDQVNDAATERAMVSNWVQLMTLNRSANLQDVGELHGCEG
jgi:hypothetical protein